MVSAIDSRPDTSEINGSWKLCSTTSSRDRGYSTFARKCLRLPGAPENLSLCPGDYDNLSALHLLHRTNRLREQGPACDPRNCRRAPLAGARLSPSKAGMPKLSALCFLCKRFLSPGLFRISAEDAYAICCPIASLMPRRSPIAGSDFLSSQPIVLTGAVQQGA